MLGNILHMKKLSLAIFLAILSLIIIGLIILLEPEVRNRGNLSRQDTEKFLSYLNSHGYHTGLNSSWNTGYDKLVKNIIFTKSIVDDGPRSQRTSSMFVFVRFEPSSMRFLLIDGKVIKVNQIP